MILEELLNVDMSQYLPLPNDIILVIPVLPRCKAVRWPTEHLTHNRDAVTLVSYPLYLALKEVPEIAHTMNQVLRLHLSLHKQIPLFDQKKKYIYIYIFPLAVPKTYSWELTSHFWRHIRITLTIFFNADGFWLHPKYSDLVDLG